MAVCKKLICPWTKNHKRMRLISYNSLKWLAFGASLPALMAGHAYAAALTFDGGASTTNWYDALNWSADALPSVSDDVYLNQTQAVTGISTGGVSQNLYVAYDSDASLSLSLGGQLTTGYLALGENVGAQGVISLNGSGTSLTSTGYIYAARYGSALLTLSGGASLLASTLRLGSFSGSSGTVVASGSGTTMSIATNIVVGAGDDGDAFGSLSILDGAVVSAQKSHMGANTIGAVGEIVVSGVGSRLLNSSISNVGNFGQGTLQVLAGGYFVATGLKLGENVGAVGHVIVDGSGSALTANSQYLIVGGYGSAFMTISNGGQVFSDWSPIANSAGGTGSVVVTGSGSKWVTTGSLVAGSGGVGSLSLLDGGSASTAMNMTIGSATGSSGSVLVRGSGSWLSVATTLNVGSAGTGSLVISNGGAVTADKVRVAYLDGGWGSLLVTGSGSSLSVANNFFVGSISSAYFSTATISDGGTVTATSVKLATVSGAKADMSVVGVGSSLLCSSSLIYIGEFGSGRLSLSEGGYVYGNLISVGVSSTGVGSVSLSGEGSLLKSTTHLYVGNDGTGHLEVSAGAVVSVDGIALVGRNAGSLGTLLLSGEGTNLFADDLYVGSSGQGVLRLFSGGGLVTNNALRIAVNSGSEGTLEIGGEEGGEAQEPGRVEAGSVDFGAGTGKIVFNHTSSGYVFSTAISGSGSIIAQAGVTYLTGDLSSYTGTTTVVGGMLYLNTSSYSGALSIGSGGTVSTNGTVSGLVSVASGGRLKGSGTVGGIDLASGATVAPGNSIGTLHVSGNVSVASGSTYEVEIDATGASDQIDATGTATLSGGDVVVSAQEGSSYGVSSSYVILTAAGGVSGAYNSVSLTSGQLPFMQAGLSYGATSVSLDLSRNNVAFADVAVGENQGNTARAIEALGSSSSLYAAVAGSSTIGAAQTSFDVLSGELHAIVKGSLLEEAGCFAQSLTEQRDAEPWLDVYASSGEVNNQGAERDGIRDSIRGFRMGHEGALRGAAGWRMGGVIGYGAQRLREELPHANNAAQAKVKHYEVAAYATRDLGQGFWARLGGQYGYHAIASDRTIKVEGYEGGVAADYGAQTLMGTTVLGYEGPSMEGVRWGLYGRGSYGLAALESFAEEGGAAALRAQSDQTSGGQAQMGVRGEMKLGTSGGIEPLYGVDPKGKLSLSGELSWSQMIGKTSTSGTYGFNETQGFSVTSASRGQSRMGVQFGVGYALTDRAKVQLLYEGLYASQHTAQGLSASFLYRF